MQVPAIHLWTGASISELEYTFWWGDQSIWFYTDFWRSLYLQESEWELCSISNIICRCILLIGNDTEFLNSIKGYLNKNFSMKDLGEATYILGIKIYRDRSRRLMGLSWSTYLGKVLKKFKTDHSKKRFLPVLQGVKLSKTQSSTMTEDRKRMRVTPYASAIGSIKYAMLCTRPDVCLAISLAAKYQSILEWITGQQSGTSWNTWKGLRICFSFMEVTKSSS